MEKEIVLDSGSSDDEGQNQVLLENNAQKQLIQNQKDKNQEGFEDSDDDSEIDQLMEQAQSQRESSGDESQLEFENQIIQQSDKNDSSDSQNDEIGKIVQMENQDQNVYDQEELEQKTENKEISEKLDGPKIKVNLRDYQKTLFKNSQDKNSIIYLPTGLGKTRIAIASMYYYLSYTQRKKIVFLANTIQLVKQQAEAIKRTLHGIIQDKALGKQLNSKHNGNEIFIDWSWDRILRQVACIHGQKNDQIGQTKKKKIQSSLISKKEFIKKFQNSTIIVCISQMFLNCLRRGIIKLTDFSFIVFDECHHCKGDHPYAGIMNQFYFDLKKKIQSGKNNAYKNLTLPKLMGLTASPIPDPQKDSKKLQRMIQQLCINMDSNFVPYPKGQNLNQTKIDIIEIKQDQEKQQRPWLLNFFTKHTSHKISYQKLQIHFPLYFQCVKQVIDLMSSRQETLKLNCSASQIHQAQLFFFYDIKECLLNKIVDVWLQLGQYSMCIAFGDMITQLNNIKGLKSEQNQKLLTDILQILRRYQIKLKTQLEFNSCSKKYFSAKLIKLIQLLTPHADDQDQNQSKLKINMNNVERLKDDDLVLVFAFKRRTVEYLTKFFDKYREKLPEEKRKYFEVTGVTGYSIRSMIRTLNEGVSYQSNPSSKAEEYKIDEKYKEYIQDYQQTMKGTAGVTNALQNQLNRFKNAKIGKFLLQTQEKYSSQLRKITQFRKKQKRVLISTSVTEQGFDIPGCNKVISFDTPFSMKAYIQIKGRARKQNSIYYIFTSEVNHKRMLQNQQLYDDTINATYEIAINRIAKKQIKSQKQDKVGYDKVATKGGALLNTNYALEVLKIYFASLAQPNKGYFHYNQTPNVCYKCIIKMPQSDPSGINWCSGEAHSTKDLALKSAAFHAVKQLKIMGLIKDDLRPSRMQQLQDQFQLQKYDDLGQIQRDQQYRQIFRKYALFEEEQEKGGNRHFLRVHFQAIRSNKLDFPKINPYFQRSLFDFQNKNAKFQFQVYHVQFSNTGIHPFMKQFANSNQIGILTAFQGKLVDKLFSNYIYRFEQNINESFTFKKAIIPIELTLEEYQNLRQIHQFLVASCDNKELLYYSQLTKQSPQPSQWKECLKSASFLHDQSRKFYPLLVLLKTVKGEKKQKQKRFQIDYNKIQKIKRHRQLFSNIYRFYNKPKNFKPTQPFNEDLTDEYQTFAQNIKGKQTITLVQSITMDFLFHKCYIKNLQEREEQLVNNSKKLEGKYNLEKRQQKFSKIYHHFKSQKNKLVQRELWRTYEKQKKLSFFDQGGIKQQTFKNDKFYFLKQFVQYPISPQTLFKISLAKKYVYDGLYSYSKALSFINNKLKELFVNRSNKQYSPMYFKHYENLLLQNSDVIFEHLADYGKSKLLQKLGRSYKSKKMINNVSKNQISFDKSQFPSMDQISGIQNVNQTINKSQQNSISFFKETKAKASETNDQFILSSKNTIYKFNENLLYKMKILDIQKVLTSKTYKHHRGQNYEQFEFMGDVVLKYLATLEMFCTRPKAVQGQMHIARANIICNANLHKKAIKNQIFRYMMASKNQQPCPPYKISYDQSKVQKEKYAGKNNQFLPLNIGKVNSASQYEGYQYIAGKVHADVVQALIGAFYYNQRKLQDCQQLLYALGVLQTPSLNIDISYINNHQNQNIPECYIELQNKIGYMFNNKGLLLQALTHPTFRTTIQTILDDRNMSKILDITQNQLSRMSFMSQKVQDYRSKIKFYQTFYERLQFLGDSVLDLMVVEHLYDKYDRGLDEGTLSLLKQAGVSNKSLGLIAVKFNLHQLTLMDIPQMDNLQKEFSKLRGSFDQFIAHPQKLQTIQISEIKLLGDVFEGLIGAILVDNDFNYYKTQKIVWNMIGKYLTAFTDKNNIKELTAMNFLKNNNYTNCKVDKISKEMKNGKFQYGLLDRKLTVIEKCFAYNQKDAWDMIMQKITRKQKGIKQQSDSDDV